MSTGGVGAAGSAGRIEAAGRLIVALDLPSAEEARAIVAALDGAACFFKIGLHLQLIPGTERLITDIIEAGNKVFLDYKIADIGASMKAAIRAAASRGVSFMTIQGGGDLTADIVHAALEGRIDGRPQIFCVTVLTSVSDADSRELHGGKPVVEVVVERARRIHAWGCDGVIASGLEPAAIKAEVSPDLLIITPGIRPRGVSSDDQRRVATPTDAIVGGADYLVVGRPIVAAPDRRVAAARIIEEMQAAFDQRG